MRSFTVLLVAVLGCATQPEAPAPPPDAVMERTTDMAPTGTDVSLSLEVGDDGGSIDASTDAGSTSVDAKVDVDVDAAKKKKRQE
jgi:hypothetical protein